MSPARPSPPTSAPARSARSSTRCRCSASTRSRTSSSRASSRSCSSPGLFNIYALLFGIFGGIVATLVNGAPLGPFWATFFTNASITDLWGSVLKTTLFGAIIAIVCCYKGMTASGGAEGVGRAVNQAVVIAIMGVFAFNYVFTQTLLATHPEIAVIK